MKIGKSLVYVFSLSFIFILLVSTRALAERISIELTVPAYSITQKNGVDNIIMEGCSGTSAPGSPRLPIKTLQVALPPDVIPQSVALNFTNTVVSVLNGTYNIGPTPAIATQDMVFNGDGWAYTQDADYPSFDVKSNGLSQMREWISIAVSYAPLTYNPVQKKLTKREGTLEISYERGTQISYLPSFLSSFPSLFSKSNSTQNYGLFDELAQKAFTNYSSAKRAWYASPASGGSTQGPLSSIFQTSPIVGETYDYVIITTNAIKTGSSQLSAFVAHKEFLGHSVLIVTEDDYGSMVGPPPNGTAEKIRTWLQNNYMTMGIEYVLLIGNPDPDSPEHPADPVGDVPMKMCYPVRDSVFWDFEDPENPGTFPYRQYAECPTDHYYADLTGSWDLDDDLYYGEWDDYLWGSYWGLLCLDFNPDVIVGRIPVYDAEYSQLDKILIKTMNYDPSSWPNQGKKMLLPIAPSDELTPGYTLGEMIKDNFALPNSFSFWRVYDEDYGIGPEIFPINYGTLGYSWVTVPMLTNEPYGVVTYSAHGNPWQIGWKSLIWDSGKNIDLCSDLDDTYPAIIFQASCMNAYPETSNIYSWPYNIDNLSYSLLKNGAIATVGATRVTWYFPGEPLDTPWDHSQSPSNAGLAYKYTGKIVEDVQTCGRALAETRLESRLLCEPVWDTASYLATGLPILMMNFLGFNLYGDPGVSLDYGGQALLGDLDGNGCVDRIDYFIIISYIRSFGPLNPIPYDPRYDLNGDMAVNIADARMLVTLYTNPRGVPCQMLPG